MRENKKGMALEYVFKIALYMIVFGVLVVLIFKLKDIVIGKTETVFGECEKPQAEELFRVDSNQRVLDYVKLCWKKTRACKDAEDEIPCYVLLKEFDTLSFVCPQESELPEEVDVVCKEEEISGYDGLRLIYKRGFVVFEEA